MIPPCVLVLPRQADTDDDLSYAMFVAVRCRDCGSWCVMSYESYVPVRACVYVPRCYPCAIAAPKKQGTSNA